MTDDPELRAAAADFAQRLAAGEANAFADWFVARGGEPPVVAWVSVAVSFAVAFHTDNLVEDERFCYFYDFRNLLVELHNKSTGRKAAAAPTASDGPTGL